MFSVLLLIEVDTGESIRLTVGGWPEGVGITLFVDRFSAIILATASVIVLSVLIYAMSQLGRDVVDWWFHPKYLALVAGVGLSLTTGDLFNLFVGFELMLIASYTLLTVRSGARQVRSTITYVVVNLLASILFLVTISVAYSASGTLDMEGDGRRVEIRESRDP